MEVQPTGGQVNLNYAGLPAGTCSSFNPEISPIHIQDFHLTGGSTSSPPQSGGSADAERPVHVPDEYSHHLPLLQAAFKGDWESAEKYFQDHPNSETADITSRRETALHIAALKAHDRFAEKLIHLLYQSANGQDPLVKCDSNGRTALHHAVLGGNILIVKALVTRNGELTQMQDNAGLVPFNLSSREASMNRKIARILAEKTRFAGPNHPDESHNAIRCIVGLTYAGHLDVVVDLLKQNPSLILKKGPEDADKSILGVLARNPSHFRSGTRLSVLNTLIYKCVPVVNYRQMEVNTGGLGPLCNLVVSLQCLTRSLWNFIMFVVNPIKRIHEVKRRNEAAVELVKMVCDALSAKNPTEITRFFQDRELLAKAIAYGSSELVKLSIQYFPDLIRILDDRNTLPTIAVQYRRERIIKLFLKESSSNGLSLVPMPTLIESECMMSAAAKYYTDFYESTNVTGAAFQMQRELQWFKAVESWVAPEVRTARPDSQTYLQMFVDSHKTLLEKGQIWVKDTADKCMLVSTLIATVLFAAAFSVPGSNNDSTLAPLKGPFLVFTIFDGLGLLSSVAAILLFLAILTSPNEPQDFLHSLPSKIIMGLSFLFLSLVFMLVAFAATLTIVLGKSLDWVAIPIALPTSIPVALFFVLQLPLLLQMVKSTYGPGIFHSKDICN